MHSESSRTDIRCQLLTHAMMFWSTRGCFSVFCTDLYYVSPMVTEKNYSFLRLVQNNQTQHQSCPFFLFLTWSCDSDLFNNTFFCIYHKEPQKKKNRICHNGCPLCTSGLSVVLNATSCQLAFSNEPKELWEKLREHAEILLNLLLKR